MVITIILNYKNKKSEILANQIIEFLKGYPVELYIPEDKPGFSPEDCQNMDFSHVDIALVLGGDGTTLSSSRAVAGFGVPVLSINMGNVGFLTSVEENQIFRSLEELLNGNYFVEERMALEAVILREGKEYAKTVALNDIVINNNYFSRTIDIEISLNDENIAEYKGDGAIIATPTGSTAYSFAAGGPLVMPQMELIMITPICSYSVFSRPLIVPLDETIKIKYKSKSDYACLAADGQVHFALKDNDIIIIKSLPKRVGLIRFDKIAFFDRVRRKIYKEE